MARILFACIFLLIVACSCITATLQDLPSLIERAMKEKEPNWQLYRTESTPRSTIYMWKLGEDVVQVEIFVTASEQAASDAFSKIALRFNVPPKERPKDLGDEALIFQSERFTSGSILFRKGSVFIKIGGSPMVDMKRFATHFAELISK